MPLPLNKSIELHVEPRRSSATLMRGWPRSRPLAHAECVVDPVKMDDDEDVVDATLRDLASKTRLQGVPVRAALSSHLIQFDVATGDFSDSSDRQLRAIATACMAELLGDQADGHELRWHLQSDERHLLICAIDRSRMTQLERASTALGLRLSSVTPAFVLAWNALAKGLPLGESVFAVSGSTDLTIAAVVDGSIAAIRVEPPLDDRGPIRDGRRAATHAAARLTNISPSAPAHATPIQFGFSEDVAQAVDVHTLDVSVDRFVARLGRDPATQAGHVLVCEDGAMPAVSRRWTVVENPRNFQ